MLPANPTQRPRGAVLAFSTRVQVTSLARPLLPAAPIPRPILRFLSPGAIRFVLAFSRLGRVFFGAVWSADVVPRRSPYPCWADRGDPYDRGGCRPTEPAGFHDHLGVAPPVHQR